MAWITCSRGALRYTGQIDRMPYLGWVKTPEGTAAVEAVAAGIGFSLFGRQRAARRLMWRELRDAAKSTSLAAAIDAEIDNYLKWLARLPYADGLPRATVTMYRLVVVPRVLLNGLAASGIGDRLGSEPALANLTGGDALRAFFVERLIREIDLACAGASPSARRPIVAPDGWASVGMNSTFVWRVPFSGVGWPGHHFVLELPRRGANGALRRAVQAGIQSLESSLKLSVAERDELLRRASVGLT